MIVGTILIYTCQRVEQITYYIVQTASSVVLQSAMQLKYASNCLILLMIREHITLFVALITLSANRYKPGSILLTSTHRAMIIGSVRQLYCAKINPTNFQCTVLHLPQFFKVEHLSACRELYSSHCSACSPYLVSYLNTTIIGKDDK